MGRASVAPVLAARLRRPGSELRHRCRFDACDAWTNVQIRRPNRRARRSAAEASLVRGSTGVLARIRFRGSRRAAAALWDPLTGLGNADKLGADLEVWAGGSPAREHVVLSVYDLMGFKEYNDAYGYHAGDALLRRLAAKLSEAVLSRGRVY